MGKIGNYKKNRKKSRLDLELMSASHEVCQVWRTISDTSIVYYTPYIAINPPLINGHGYAPLPHHFAILRRPRR